MNLLHSDLADATATLARAQSHAARGEFDEAREAVELGIELANGALRRLQANAIARRDAETDERRDEQRIEDMYARHYARLDHAD